MFTTNPEKFGAALMWLVYLSTQLTAMGFIKKLKDNDWTEIAYNWEYRKGNWVIKRDSGTWWIVGTRANPRIFDVPEPGSTTAVWTVNLIEHLCQMDEKARLMEEVH
jgi:hypothetical protein